MQANLNLVINALLLAGVIFAIARMVRGRRKPVFLDEVPPSEGRPQVSLAQDDIIAVRKINPDHTSTPPSIKPQYSGPTLGVSPRVKDKPAASRVNGTQTAIQQAVNSEPGVSVMMFLLAKGNRQLAGYELLQTVLAAGLRFGEGHLFHRHQSPNGQGPVLCSLAAATPSGVFDLQNIGAFSVRGLCLFMHASGNPTIDGERFAIMLDTAKQLSEGLDTLLLDDKQQPLSDASIERYYQQLQLNEVSEI